MKNTVRRRTIIRVKFEILDVLLGGKYKSSFLERTCNLCHKDLMNILDYFIEKGFISSVNVTNRSKEYYLTDAGRTVRNILDKAILELDAFGFDI